MSFFQNFKAKRAAKKAKKLYEKELAEYNYESDLLSRALEIFNDASKGEEPSDQGLVQKAGELVLWTGSAVYHEAGRTPSKYVGGSTGFSVPVVAGIRVRVGSFRGHMVPGEEMQLDKDQGLVKLTNQRLIFSGSITTTEWAFSKLLSAVRTEDGNDFLLGVSNRKKTSGLRFSKVDGPYFARLFAMALFCYEEGLAATIKTIKDEIKALESNKPALVIPSQAKELN